LLSMKSDCPNLTENDNLNRYHDLTECSQEYTRVGEHNTVLSIVSPAIKAAHANHLIGLPSWFY